MAAAAASQDRGSPPSERAMSMSLFETVPVEPLEAWEEFPAEVGSPRAHRLGPKTREKGVA
jgi:hypothetical protein